MMDVTKRAYLELHIAILLFGFTAILGDLIQLSAVVMVWWRVLLTSISLLLLINVRRLLQTMPTYQIKELVLVGGLVGLHWITFYGAIKIANASIALICMATTSFFTAILEPIIFKQPVKKYELFLGVLIVPGMILIVNSAEEINLRWGILVGLLSAFFAAWFTILNKQRVEWTTSLNMTFIELSSACLLITIIFPFYFYYDKTALFWPSLYDWGYLLVLALLCTTLAYALTLRSLKHLSAFATNLTINLEPVYGIFLAWIILKDNKELNPSFYIGVVIIVLSVLSYPFLKKYFQKTSLNHQPN